ncbi:MAG: hypothetical protein P8049_10315 [Gemmatimonadota bacterium]
MPEQSFARRVDQLQPVVFVEGQKRHVDDRHDTGQKVRGLERVEALIMKRLRQLVDLVEDEAQCIISIRGARAERIVALAKSLEHVRDRVQGSYESLAQVKEKNDPAADDEERDRPLGALGEIAGPDQQERNGGRRRPRRESEQRNQALVGQPAADAPDARGMIHLACLNASGLRPEARGA